MAGDRPKRARAGACQNCRLSLSPGQHVPSNLPTRSLQVREEDAPTPKPLPARPDLVLFREKQPREAQREPPRVEIVLTNELALELVSIYFRYIHNVAHTLFHEASFMMRLKQGRAFMVHVYAMCALAARFSHHRAFDEIAPHARGKSFAATAVTLLQQQSMYASLQTVQACVLLATLIGGDGESQTKQVYDRLARQHAEILSLWVMPDGIGVIDREERRRTWLSVCIADQWSSANLSVEPVPPPAQEVLPAVDDVEFHTYDPELLREDYASSRCNMWSHMTRALEIYTGIRGLLRRLSRGMISFDTYRVEVSSWRQHLDRWTERLPEGMVYSTANIKSFATQGLGRTFLSMHIGYHHFQQMLYFPFLDARAGNKAAQQGYNAAQCRSSANIVSEIIQCSTGTKDCELNHFLYGHIVMISSCVHLYTLCFGEESAEQSMARRRLLSNFEYLMRLKLHWPIVEHFVKRLRIFQTLCQSSMSDPFATENWMARFLTEEASKLSERQSLFHDVDSDDEACIAGPTEKIETNGSFRSRLSESTYPKSPGTEWSTLSSLLNDQNMTSEAFVNNALGWLLE
ncbi:hypothetical protein MW887_006335 [Aspergillus wentii]|nr:hypothetical protein MW887_006335 [Aspergillus wentii]